MAAEITFWADTEHVINLGGSGLGFFGSSFTDSVNVGEFQDSTYITSSDGSIEGPQVNNVKWTHPGSGSINGTSSINLQYCPNRLASLNIRFTNDTPVRLQNSKFIIFDRSNLNNPASGVLVKAAEVIHPDPNQANISASSDSTWSTPGGSSVIMNLVTSPGMSGLRINGASTNSDRHDFYVNISASPTSVGSKTQFGGYFETEYL